MGSAIVTGARSTLFGSPTIAALARLATAGGPVSHLADLRLADAGYGFDVFGMNADYVALTALLAQPVYRGWFRVRSEGLANIPAQGPVILVANHGGMLPFDGAMIWTDVVTRMRPTRIPRAVGDYFVPRLPLVSTVFQRSGAVGGSRGNAHRLLRAGELLLIFPEGTAGVGKPLRERYRLQRWSVGHAEMAIRHRATVIPVSVVGPDDQAPLTLRLPMHPFGVPYLPIPPFPLPVRYYIDYGAPIALHEAFEPGDADDTAIVNEAARRVRDALQAMIDRRRSLRKGVFA